MKCTEYILPKYLAREQNTRKNGFMPFQRVLVQNGHK